MTNFLGDRERFLKLAGILSPIIGALVFTGVMLVAFSVEPGFTLVNILLIVIFIPIIIFSMALALIGPFLFFGHLSDIRRSGD